VPVGYSKITTQVSRRKTVLSPFSVMLDMDEDTNRIDKDKNEKGAIMPPFK